MAYPVAGAVTTFSLSVRIVMAGRAPFLGRPRSGLTNAPSSDGIGAKCAAASGEGPDKFYIGLVVAPDKSSYEIVRNKGAANQATRLYESVPISRRYSASGEP
jgi:hypothetical protein